MSPEPCAIALLGWIARAKAIACKGYYGEAEEWLAANRAPERAQRIFKAATGARLMPTTVAGMRRNLSR